MRTCALSLSFMVLLLPALAGAAHHEEAEAAAAAPEAAAPEAPVTPPTKPWNQEEMTKLSAQLATQMGEVRDAFRRGPTYRDPVASNQRAAAQLGDTLGQLERSTRQLRDRVAGGGDMESTRPVARRIGTLLRDADVQSNRLMTTQWTNERIKPTMETLNAIAPFYGSGPLYDPETMQRVAP